MVTRVKQDKDTAQTVDVIAVRDGNDKRDIKVGREKANGIVHTFFSRAGGAVNSNRFNFTASDFSGDGSIRGYGAYAATGGRVSSDPAGITNNIHRFYQAGAGAQADIWFSITGTIGGSSVTPIYVTITRQSDNMTLNLDFVYNTINWNDGTDQVGYRAQNANRFIESGGDYSIDFFTDSARTAPLNIGTRPVPLPAISAFNLQPEYRLDSQGGNTIISWTITGSTSSEIIGAAADGTRITITIQEPSGSGDDTISPSPSQNVEYILNISNAAEDIAQARKTFYRVISPTLSATLLSTHSYPLVLGGAAITRVVNTIRITRGGTPLPVFGEITSSAGTTISQDPNRDPDATVIDLRVQRNRAPGDTPLADTITIPASTTIPVSGFTPIPISRTVDITWAAG